MVEIRASEISKAVHYIFMTSQRSKILGMEFLPKTPSTETPGFLKFENGENMKHPNVHRNCKCCKKSLNRSSTAHRS